MSDIVYQSFLIQRHRNIWMCSHF